MPNAQVAPGGRTAPAFDERRLARIVSHAASPWERVDPAGAFRPVGGSNAATTELAEYRLRRWATAVGDGTPAALRRSLAQRGADVVAARSAVGEVVVVHPDRVPAWARELRRLLAATEVPPCSLPPWARTPLTVRELLGDDACATAGVPGDAPWSAYGAYAPLLAAAARWLARRDRDGVVIAPAARRQLLVRLARRWSTIAAQALTYRVTAIDVLAGCPARLGSTVFADAFQADDVPGEGWWRVFDAYPVLGRLMAVVYRQWRTATAELLRRAAADAPLLARRFGTGGSLGRIAWVSPDAGDTHAGGRAVTVVGFADGTTLVYKPKDLRVARGYARLVRALHGAGLRPRLHVRRILAHKGYAWEAYVGGGSATDAAGVRRFYRRLGMHARLVQLTDGSDFTSDNVLAAGSHPVLVDLEALLSPRLRDPTSGPPDAAAARAAARAADSPTRGGFVSAHVRGALGQRWADVGALAPGWRRTAPFRQLTVARRADGTVGLQSECPVLGASAAAPRIDGQVVESAGHFDAIADGYVAMARLLRRSGRHGHVAAALGALGGTRVRLICRDTQVYVRLLEASLRPECLRDGVSRELCLERLWRAEISDAAIIRAEVDALRALDIPYFYARADRNALGAPGVAAIAGVLDEPATDTLRRRLCQLEERTDADERAIIKAHLFAMDERQRECGPPRRGGHGGVGMPARRHNGSAAPAEGDWLGWAAAAAAGLLAAADLDPCGGAPAWVGAQYHPLGDAWTVAALERDLLTGTAGVAVVLAELARTTGRAAYAAAAAALAVKIVDGVESVPAAAAAVCGAFGGWAGGIYAAHRVARALDDPVLGRRVSVAALVASEPSQLVGATPHLTTGLAGLLLVLTSLAQQGDAAHRAALVDRAVGVERMRRDTPHAPSPGRPAILRRLPSDDVADALAHVRIAALCGQSPAPATLAPLCAAWRAVDLRAALSVSGASAAEIALRRTALSRARTLLARGARVRSAAAHLELGELALAVHAASDVAADRDTAARHGRALTNAWRETGAWFPTSLLPDQYHHSAVDGVCAVVDFLHRLHAPNVAPLRLLA